MKRKLSSKFEMDDRGEIHHLLGMHIKRNREKKQLFLDQSLYLENVLKKFNFMDCKPVSTPMENGKKFNSVGDEDVLADVRLYQAAIGSIMYASLSTRPDLSASVGVLSHFMTKPGNEHWSGIKRIFRYIKGTLKYGLMFEASGDFFLTGYSDSDWAGDIETRKSTSGYLFMLGKGSISWSSKK